MDDERIIRLNWVERFEIKYALLAEAERLKDLHSNAIRLHLEADSVDAINERINNILRLADKIRDKD